LPLPCSHHDAHWDFSECLGQGSHTSTFPVNLQRTQRAEHWVYRKTWARVDSVPVEGALLYAPTVYQFVAAAPTMAPTYLALHGPQPSRSGYEAPVPYARDLMLERFLYDRCAPESARSPEAATCVLNRAGYTNGSFVGNYGRETFVDELPPGRLPRQGFIWTDDTQTSQWAIGLRRYPDPVNGPGGPLFFLDNAYMRSRGLNATDGPCTRGHSGTYRRDWRNIPPNRLEVRTPSGIQTINEGRYMTGCWALGPGDTDLHVVATWDDALSGLEVAAFQEDRDYFPPAQPRRRRRTTDAGFRDLGVPNAVWVYAQDREVTNYVVTQQAPSPPIGPRPSPTYQWTEDGGATWHALPGQSLPTPGGSSDTWNSRTPGYIVTL
jgi:hypothetical protein